MIEIFYQMWDVNIAIAMFAGILGGLMHGFTGWGGAMIMMPIVTLVYGPIQSLGMILIGGMIPINNLQSTIESPDSVKRVKPPKIIIKKTKKAKQSNQLPI